MIRSTRMFNVDSIISTIVLVKLFNFGAGEILRTMMVSEMDHLESIYLFVIRVFFILLVNFLHYSQHVILLYEGIASLFLFLLQIHTLI